MPHICTRCNNTFESGEDILKGCPVCGWKKFMFVRRLPAGENKDRLQSEQIITKSMGVRVPPKSRQGEEIAAERSSERASFTPQQHHPLQPFHDTGPTMAPQAEDKMAEDKKLESIKITAPGTYELNLPSLFERDELIMAVKEGTYFIDLTSAFRKGKKD
jgi:predicted  nucleic acid-binding Zn-ribbon protein